MKKRTLVFALAGLVFGTGVVFAQQQPAQPQSTGGNIIYGNTHPSVHAKLGLHDMGVVLDIPVEEGQVVKKGDLLLQQDSRQDEALLEGLQLEANSTVKTEAARADAKIRHFEYDRKKSLLANKASSLSEVEEAQVKVVYGEATVKVQELEEQTNKLKVKQQQVKVEQMKLISPIDGIVETIDVSVGEVTDPQKPFMTVVKNDPLWVEFYLPTTQSLKLKVGQQLEVKYDDEQQWQPAKLIYRAPVADYGSNQQKIRLEMPNPQLKDAGLQVQVKLPAELGPAAPAAALAPNR